ncbi:hypothetical protein RN001_006190 [Aquatica leii]|uniref:Regulatory protein zeste n=1 Tax=Aquatica leii TaxID=1421715 RepID=A0AAN7SB53_9COLE|nr:hypothetical protein RN001_006190 [Aquatica leii]
MNKRERSKNFLEEEKENIIELVKKYRAVIENKKKTNAVSTRDKTLAWEQIAKSFNSSAKTGQRSGIQLKLLYDNIKKNAKRHKSDDKARTRFFYEKGHKNQLKCLRNATFCAVEYALFQANIQSFKSTTVATIFIYPKQISSRKGKFFNMAGLLGNLCTCIVIARNKCMHTTTNYYLFSLAVSDLLLLISGLPNEIYSTWSKYPYIFGETFCVLQGFAAETSANATVLTITAFTIERYLAICHPFLSHTMSKLSRAIKYIIGIWVLAMSLALPQAMAFGIFHEESTDVYIASDDHYVCTIKRVVIPYAFEISTLVFFIAPMSLITILYILIGISINKSTNIKNRDGSIKLKHYQNKSYPSNTSQHTKVVLGRNLDNIQIMYQDAGRKNYPRNSQASKHVVKMLGK